MPPKDIEAILSAIADLKVSIARIEERQDHNAGNFVAFCNRQHDRDTSQEVIAQRLDGRVDKLENWQSNANAVRATLAVVGGTLGGIITLLGTLAAKAAHII